jgi:hypothetical protein
LIYFPKLQKALANLGVLPHRTFNNIQEFKDIFSDIEEIINDVIVLCAGLWNLNIIENT